MNLLLLAALSLPASAQAPKQPGGEIAALIHVNNDAEVAAGEMALQKAEGVETRRFAQMMVDQHNASNRELSDAKIRPEKTEAVKASEAKAKEDAKALRRANAGEFDALYLGQQVQAHQALLAALDRALADRPGLGAFAPFVEKTRGVVAQHLQQAQAAQRSLTPP